nr:hypothetical protein [Actinospica robiniae]
MATQWVIRDQRMTSALIGASSVSQLEQNNAAVSGRAFTSDKLSAIDVLAVLA